MKLKGTIIAAHGRQYLVELADGETLLCFPRGKKSELACGDIVSIQRSSDTQGVIDATDPRHSLLYDKARLAQNAVPVSAVVYHDDMYVDAGLSMQTAMAVGNLDVWITNEFEHDGIRQSGGVFDRLVALVAEKGGPLKASR